MAHSKYSRDLEIRFLGPPKMGEKQYMKKEEERKTESLCVLTQTIGVKGIQSHT